MNNNTERLKALGLATILSLTLSCHSAHQNSALKEENADLSSKIESLKEENADLTSEVADLEQSREKLNEDIKSQDEKMLKLLMAAKEYEEKISRLEAYVSIEIAKEALDDSLYYDEASKKFISSFANIESIEASTLLDIATGDVGLLGGRIGSSNTPAPLGYSRYAIATPKYKAEDLAVFDNRSGKIESLPKSCFMLIKEGVYENFSVYAVNGDTNPDFHIILDEHNNLVGHTQNGYTNLSSLNLKISSLSDYLSNLGLSKNKNDIYSSNDLLQIKIAISKKLAGYQEQSKIKTKDIMVLDTTDGYDYNHIYERDMYYFLRLIAPNAFASDCYYYQDVFNPYATFSINRKEQSFFYEDITEDDYMPFYLTEEDLRPGINAIKDIKTILSEQSLSGTNLGTYTSIEELSKIRETLNIKTTNPELKLAK